MHEPLYARAARPAPAIVLGLLLRPFSIGHQTILIREGNPLAEGFDATGPQLSEAALICSQTWAESLRMPFDPLITLKLWLWRRRSGKLFKTLSAELTSFLEYRDFGSLELPISDTPRP